MIYVGRFVHFFKNENERNIEKMMEHRCARAFISFHKLFNPTHLMVSIIPIAPKTPKTEQNHSFSPSRTEDTHNYVLEKLLGNDYTKLELLRSLFYSITPRLNT